MTTVTLDTVQSHKESFLTTYVFSMDHKMIGKQFLIASFLMLFLGGCLAMAVRWQLGFPDTPLPGGTLLPETMVDEDGFMLPEFYNVLFSMHASIMIFFAVIPLLNGWFANFVLPLQIGARDMASPLLNMISFWFYVLAGIIVLSGFFVEGGAAAAGWTSYPPLSALAGMGQTLWIIGVMILGFSSIMGSINYITTVFKLRAPGMAFGRMPLPVWAIFITAFMTLLATPVLTTAMIMLLLDNAFGTSFFLPELIVSGELTETSGGKPLLYQHIFWFYSHPAVYIMIMPAFGVVSEVISVFSRKPIFGYKMMVGSLISIAGMSFIVWAHHMYQSGLNATAAKFFMFTTIVITIPPTILIFNWLATLLGGNIRLRVPMLHALAFLSMFMIGGLSGLFLASTYGDIFFHDTYFVVAHLHYVLFGGSLFGIFAGTTYWFPKAFGRMMNQRLGQIHFWLTLIFFNLTFFTMHFLGFAGHMRRIAEPMNYPFLESTQGLHTFITISALILGASQLIFAFNFIRSIFRGKEAPANPWDANTLEWS
ncbi:MAG: cbb3-type cytochrome c oxidase subunit I, partial [SAR324 cluster bacterium]|nr:cbb3-type cytochrome c oxidase subunit I [SAR324 cluster bacterium]